MRVVDCMAALASLVLHVLTLRLFCGFASIPLERTEPPTTTVVPLVVSILASPKPVADVGSEDWMPSGVGLKAAITIPLPDLPPIEAVAADSVEESRFAADLKDVEEIRRLQGIYVTQIASRLARVLNMIGGEGKIEVDPRCVVHVIQDEHGSVLELDLLDCSGESESLDRIARAVRAASPLPLPPAGLAMGTYLTFHVTDAGQMAVLLN